MALFSTLEKVARRLAACAGTSSPQGKTREKYGENTGEKDAVKRACPANRCNWGAHALQLVEIEQISPYQSADAATDIRDRGDARFRHEKGDTFSEIYLSYLSGPKGVRIPSSEFFAPFPPDLKFGYRRDTHKTPEHFIRAYHLHDRKTGKDGPWLAGLTLEPSVVYEAWCSQRPGGIIVMIEEIHGKPTKAGESFSAAHIVGYFDTIDDMHKLYDRHKGHTGLAADASGWRLVK